MIAYGYTATTLKIYQGIGYNGLISEQTPHTYKYEMGYWSDPTIQTLTDNDPSAETSMLRIRETDKVSTKDFILLDIPAYLWIPAADLHDQSVLLDYFGDGHILLLCPSGHTCLRQRLDNTLVLHVDKGKPKITKMSDTMQKDLALSISNLDVLEVHTEVSGPALTIAGEEPDTLPSTSTSLPSPAQAHKAQAKKPRKPKKAST